MPSSGTSNFNRRGIMKKSILIVLISILLSCPMNLVGAEYETLHEFKAGDTISAEMMNELFEYISKSKKLITNDELEALNQMKIKQLKNRYNDPAINRAFIIGVDRAKMRLYDVEQAAQKIVESNQETQEQVEGTAYDKFSGFKV